MDNEELKQAAVVEAVFVDAARSARSFAIIMRDNNVAKEIFSRLFTSFKGLSVNDVDRHAREIHSWLVGAPDPAVLAGQVDGLHAPFPDVDQPLEQARMRVLDIVRQVRLQEQIDLPNDTAVLLLRIGLMMYNRVFRGQQHPGPIHRIPLLIDRAAFDADPIALECAKYILTGDTTGTIFRRQPSSPPVNPKDDIRAHVMANLQLSTLMKAVMSSFEATKRMHVHLAVANLRTALAQLPGVPNIDLGLPVNDPNEENTQSLTGVAVSKINQAVDLKFALMQACATFGEAIGQLVSKKYRVAVWNSERQRLEAEKNRYQERLATLRMVMWMIDVYRTVFKTFDTRLEALVSVVEPVAKTTDAAVLASRRASAALTTFIAQTRVGRRPVADLPTHAPPGLGVFARQIPTEFKAQTGQVQMSSVFPNASVDSQESENAYNRLAYFGVLMVCVIGKDEEILRTVSREQMHLQGRLARLAERLPSQEFMNYNAEMASASTAHTAATARLVELQRHGAENVPAFPAIAVQPSADTITDILALSSLFPVAKSDKIDHLATFALTESRVVRQSIVDQRFQAMGIQSLSDRGDFALGSLETVSDFLGVLTPHSQDPAKSTLVSDSLVTKRVTEDVSQRVALEVKSSMDRLFGTQRDILAKSIVATNEARRKYEKGIEGLSGKQRVFLNSAYPDQVPMDNLDEASIKAVNADFLDEIRRMGLVVDRIPDIAGHLIRNTDSDDLRRCIGVFSVTEGPGPHDADRVPWATPLMDVFRGHQAGNFDNHTAFMMMLVVDQTMDRLQTRWHMWKAGTDQKRVEEVDVALTRLVEEFGLKKTAQFDRVGDLEAYGKWATFVRALPSARPDDSKALDERSAKLLGETLRLQAENERLKRQLDDEKKYMHERARDDLAKIDLQRQRDSDAYDNRISEMKVKMMMDKRSAASGDKGREQDRLRVNDREKEKGRGAVPMTGQAYVLNAMGGNESAAARVMDMAMDPIGLRLPMGFMHPFETQFRPDYRKGFNPLFWYQLLREFVRTVATTANLAADRCLTDAMPDASLVQYAAFYEPQGYNPQEDQFSKDFRQTPANQLFLPGRTEGNEYVNNPHNLLRAQNITPFIREKIEQKHRNADDFLSMEKARAVRARIDFLKARQAAGPDMNMNANQRPQPDIVAMGISREMQFPETKFFLENVDASSRAPMWSWDIANRAGLMEDNKTRTMKETSEFEFQPMQNVLNEKTFEFINSFNGTVPSNDPDIDRVYAWEIPIVVLVGNAHSPRLAIVAFEWTYAHDAPEYEPLAQLFKALEIAANDTGAVGVVVLARMGGQELGWGASFVGSRTTVNTFMGKKGPGEQKQYIRSLLRDPSPDLVDIVFKDLVASLPPDAAQGNAAPHIRQQDQPEDAAGADAPFSTLDDFLARQAGNALDDIDIGDRKLQNMTMEELEAYQKDHLELADHVRELAAQEAKFIAEMKRLSRVHAGNMENVLGEYLAPEPPLAGIKQALHYARQLFRKNKKESPLLLAEFLVSSVANDDFAALTVAYIRKNNAMANNVVATKQLVTDTNQMLGLAQGSMSKLGYMPKLTPFQNLAPDQDPFIDGRAYSDFFYFQHERQDFAQADSFTRRY